MDPNKCKSLVLFYPKPIKFHESCIPQVFDIPLTTMKYIWTNPSSPEVYQKLIKSCKFFFVKNPILVISNANYDNYTGWTYCNKDECDNECFLSKHINIDINNLFYKIWIVKRFCVDTNESSIFASRLISKICRYDVKELKLCNQWIQYDKLKFLSKGVKKCSLYWNFIRDSNGEEVALENIIQLFSKAEKIHMNFGNYSRNAACKSYDDFIDACKTVKNVALFSVPNVFSVPDFYQHLKTSKCRSKIYICSWNPIERLDEVIDEILSTTQFSFVPPVLYYSHIDYTKLEIMKQRQEFASLI
uniref:Uncharacterized protein n=1 Tax=Panagrolaimus sp. ES5 TaxID=591445 RepID=A0AC34FSH2_9BILA